MAYAGQIATIRETLEKLGSDIEEAGRSTGEFQGFWLPLEQGKDWETGDTAQPTPRLIETALKDHQLDSLIQRIQEKDRLLHHQAQLISHLQDQISQFHSLSQSFPSKNPRFSTESLEQELQKEKKLRIEAETRLHQAKISASGQQINEITEGNKLEKLWKCDLIALKQKLDENTQQKCVLMQENANLQTELEKNQVIILKLREEIRRKEEKQAENQQKEAKLMTEFRLSQTELVKLRKQNDELITKISNFSIESSEIFHFQQKISFLESEISKFRIENNNLRLEISTMQEIKSKNRDLDLYSPVSVSSSKAVLEEYSQEIRGVLGVERSLDVFPAILRLKKEKNSAERLIMRVKMLFKDCFPRENVGKEEVTDKEIWRWVRWLVEDYMRISKVCREMSTSEAVLREMCEIMGVKEGKELVFCVKNVLEEGKVQGKVIERMREMLKVSARKSMAEVLEQVSASTGV